MKRSQKKMLNRQKPATLNMNPEDLPDVACECGGLVFIPGLTMKKISALISPKGQEGYANFPVSICVKCFTPLPLKP